MSGTSDPAVACTGTTGAAVAAIIAPGGAGASSAARRHSRYFAKPSYRRDRLRYSTPIPARERTQMKGQQKPKKLGKKAPLKSLKEKRAAKRDASKPGRGLDV